MSYTLWEVLVNDEHEPSPITRVLLVDDHRIVREGIAAVLARESDIQVVGEAASAEEALEKLRLLETDVVVLDLQMPGMGGLQAIRQLKVLRPATSILVLTVAKSEIILLEAVRAGAAGYVLKDASSDILVQTIRLILQGGTVIDSQLLIKALHGSPASWEADPGPDNQLDSLTPREMEVLKLLARGMGNQEIADTLGTTRVTAKKHVHHIIGKLQVSDRTQAALRAVRMGMVE